MLDPVKTAAGDTYERAAIESWFAKGAITSPITNTKLDSSTLTPNEPLKRSISNFLEEQATRVKDLQAEHINACRELQSYGPAAAAALGDEEWFDKGRERLRSVMSLTNKEKEEASAVAARLQQLEREQISMHAALQKLEAAKIDNANNGAASGGIVNSLGRGLWLMVELFFTLGVLGAPLGPFLLVCIPAALPSRNCQSHTTACMIVVCAWSAAFMPPEMLSVGRVGPPLSRAPMPSVATAIPEYPGAASRAGSAPTVAPPSSISVPPPPPQQQQPTPPPPPPPPCEDDSGDGKGVLVEGSDCASYLLFPGCDSDLHELFGTIQSSKLFVCLTASFMNLVEYQ